MKGQEYNFDVLSKEDVDSLGLPYDYNSIMHYAKNTFSKSSYLDTIQPIGVLDNERIEIGQRKRLSSGDIAQANLLYKCAVCGQTFQQNSGQIKAPHYVYGNAGSGSVKIARTYEQNSEEESANGLTSEFEGSGHFAADDALKVEFDRSLELCEWRISATNGERIILQIHELV